MALTYTIQRIQPGQLGDHDWQNPLWDKIAPVNIDQFHARSSEHHPKVAARVLHDQRSIFLKFDVQDRYVLAQAEKFNDSVCIDSCVEFFVKPLKDHGYFNFEFNCGGTMLVSYIEDPTRTEHGFKKYEMLKWEYAKAVVIDHSLPKKVLPEIETPTNWWVGVRIPLSVMEAYVSRLGELGGQQWTANFYKCADKSSHPHWASWSPIGTECRFHQPDKFGKIVFGAEPIAR